MNNSIINLSLRLILGLNFLFVPLAHFKIWHFYLENPDDITSWITSQPFIGSFIAVGLFITSIFILFGFKSFWATCSGIALLLLNHIALLFTNPANDPFDGPFYNSFHHSVPFISFSILLLYTLSSSKELSIDRLLQQVSNKVSLDRKNEIVFQTARLFIGFLFFAQGLSLLTDESTLMSFAENVYVKNYETTFLPKFLLWLMGLSNPWILTIGGFCVILGFKIKFFSYLLAFFMVSIAFGHLLGDPFETTGDISMYGFCNFAVVLLVLWFENGKNIYTLDRFFIKK
jgi:uncharacterized membrane protein YphA (DoxX/SURF4 family)